MEEELKNTKEEKVSEKIEEPVVETDKREEALPKNEEENNVNIVNLSDFKDDKTSIEESTETARKGLLKMYTDSKKYSRIILIAVVVVIIGAMLLITLKQTWSTVLGYVLAGLTLVGLLLYYILTKNKFPNASKKYIRDFTTRLDAYIFSDGNFTDMKVDIKEKFELTDLLGDRVYKGIIDSGSRNIVRGFFNKRSVTVGEAALYVVGDKKVQKKVIFLGKYISYPNSLSFDNRFIIVSRSKSNDKNPDQPNDIDDLKPLLEEEKFIIYGPEGVDYKKVLTTKFISAIKAIDVDGNFMNMNVVVWGGHTAFYLSYDDPVVSIPFDKPFNKAPQEAFKSNLMEALEAAKLICK